MQRSAERCNAAQRLGDCLGDVCRDLLRLAGWDIAYAHYVQAGVASHRGAELARIPELTRTPGTRRHDIIQTAAAERRLVWTDDAHALPTASENFTHLLCAMPVVARGEAVIVVTFFAGRTAAEGYLKRPELHADIGDLLDAVFGHLGQVVEREQLEREVRQRSIEALSAVKMAALGEMAGGLAHEINNPLAIIELSVSRLQRLLANLDNDNLPASRDAAQASLGSIRGGIERVSSIIRGLQLFARDGSHDPEVVCDLSEVIDRVSGFVAEKFRQTGVDLRVDQADADILVAGRPTELFQLFANLLHNAIEAVAHQAEAWVSISCTQATGSIRVTVTDSGPGVKEEVAAKMFDPFFTTKDVGQGVGLGLSISEGIARTHQGRLYLDDAQAHTCFVVELPRHQPQINPAAA